LQSFTDESIRAGTRVELLEAIYGYDAGSIGVVVHAGRHEQLLVRFDSTGHAMYVDRALLKPVSIRSVPEAR
jgi:hypothetical protein